MSSGGDALRVGLIGPCPPPHGGVTRVVQNHLRCWQDRSPQVWLMSIDRPAKAEPYPEVTWVDGSEAVSFAAYVAAAFRVGWRFGPCSWASFKKLLAFDVSVRAAIRRHSLDVIYVHHSSSSGLIGVCEAHAAGIPAVVASYGETWLAEPDARRWKRAIEYSVRNADWVVATSEHCRNGTVARGRPRAETSVIYAGIDLERFAPGADGTSFRAQLGVPADAIVVSVLGLALRRKLDTFLGTLDQLLKNQNVYVLIGGVGRDKAYLDERIRQVPGGRAVALGFVPEEQLPSFYAATDILVVAPNTLVECMGQSMKEAMACGRAVVGARLGGVPEALEAGRCGLMFEPDDPVDLVRAIETLIHDPNLRAELGRNGRAEAEKRFDARVSAEEMYAVLARAVERAPGARPVRSQP